MEIRKAKAPVKRRSFSWKRVYRGLYKSSKGLINADVNGSLNIIRKVVPNAFAKGIEGSFVSTPLSLSVQ